MQVISECPRGTVAGPHSLWVFATGAAAASHPGPADLAGPALTLEALGNGEVWEVLGWTLGGSGRWPPYGLVWGIPWDWCGDTREPWAVHQLSPSCPLLVPSKDPGSP